MPSIVATDRAHLDFVIAERLEKYGPKADLNDIDVSAIEDFSMLFANQIFSGDVSRWNTGSATKMRGMFTQTQFNGDVSKWNVANVRDMALMFENTPFQGDLSKWDVRQVADFRHMFAQGSYDGDLSAWSVNDAAGTSFMFSLQESLISPASKLRLPFLPVKEDMTAFFGYKEEPYEAWRLNAPLGPNHWQEVIKMVAIDNKNDAVEKSGKRRPIQWPNEDPEQWPHKEMLAQWLDVRDVHAGLGLSVRESAISMAHAMDPNNQRIPIFELPCLATEGMQA